MLIAKALRGAAGGRGADRLRGADRRRAAPERLRAADEPEHADRDAAAGSTTPAPTARPGCARRGSADLRRTSGRARLDGRRDQVTRPAPARVRAHTCSSGPQRLPRPNDHQLRRRLVLAEPTFCYAGLEGSAGGRMPLRTRFTELVGCSVPIQQAGMGAASPSALAAAVSEAGGLGTLGTARALRQRCFGSPRAGGRARGPARAAARVHVPAVRRQLRHARRRADRPRVLRDGGGERAGGRPVPMDPARPRADRSDPPRRRAGRMPGRLARGGRRGRRRGC